MNRHFKNGIVFKEMVGGLLVPVAPLDDSQQRKLHLFSKYKLPSAVIDSDNIVRYFGSFCKAAIQAVCRKDGERIIAVYGRFYDVVKEHGGISEDDFDGMLDEVYGIVDEFDRKQVAS